MGKRVQQARGAYWLGVAALLAGCASDDPAESRSLGEAPTVTSTADGPTSASAAPVPDPEPEPSPDELVLVAGGDINLGREQGQVILADPSYDPFRKIRPWLAGADLRFANLESQLSDQGGETQSPHHKLVFTGPPGGAEVLKRAGFDIVSLANNHAWDYQRRGFEETLANLERVGVAYTGVSRERGKHYEPTIVRVDGWSLAFFAVTHIWNAGRYSTHPGQFHVAWANWGQLAKRVEKAHREHDLVIVSYHGGVEYRDTPYPPAARFIAAAMNSGHVDVLLGHHPHVPRGVGWFGERPALYSLGNLVFGKRSDNRWERTSFLARLTFRRRADERPLTKLELCPYDLRGHSPEPFAGPEMESSRRELETHVRAISTTLGDAGSGTAGGTSAGPIRDRGTTVGGWSDDGCLGVSAPAP